MITRYSTSDLMNEYCDAFAKGLQQHFSGELGVLLGAVVKYHPSMNIDEHELRKTIETDAGLVLTKVVGGTVDSGTMQTIQEAMIGSALLNDPEGVVRWAKAGETRCAKADPAWANTTAQWQWVQANTKHFITHARSLKGYLGLR